MPLLPLSNLTLSVHVWTLQEAWVDYARALPARCLAWIQAGPSTWIYDFVNLSGGLGQVSAQSHAWLGSGGCGSGVRWECCCRDSDISYASAQLARSQMISSGFILLVLVLLHVVWFK